MPTTSAKTQYVLKRQFFMLFEVDLSEEAAKIKIKSWQKKHLDPGVFARIQILKQGVVAASEGADILVRFPNGETRMMPAGPSSVISKAVVEDFASRFLKRPGVVFLSEPGNKVVSGHPWSCLLGSHLCSYDGEMVMSSGLGGHPGFSSTYNCPGSRFSTG